MNFKSDLSHFINFVFESSSISSISLCGGMLGYVLVLYQLGQKSKCQFITHYADTNWSHAFMKYLLICHVASQKVFQGLDGRLNF